MEKQTLALDGLLLEELDAERVNVVHGKGAIDDAEDKKRCAQQPAHLLSTTKSKK